MWHGRNNKSFLSGPSANIQTPEKQQRGILF
jgi:hypothetical protein